MTDFAELVKKPLREINDVELTEFVKTFGMRWDPRVRFAVYALLPNAQDLTIGGLMEKLPGIVASPFGQTIVGAFAAKRRTRLSGDIMTQCPFCQSFFAINLNAANGPDGSDTPGAITHQHPGGQAPTGR